MKSCTAGATVEIRTHDKTALLEVRQVVSEAAHDIRFGLVEMTKLITASSELTRNIVQHAGAGRVIVEKLDVSSRLGLRLTFEDEGPGIPDVALAMQDGYTTARGMGWAYRAPSGSRMSSRWRRWSVRGPAS